MKIVIVGAVAGVPFCAARLRRPDESAEIEMIEKGLNVYYPNYGLPYHIGGVIEQEKSLLVANAELLTACGKAKPLDYAETVEILAEPGFFSARTANSECLCNKCNAPHS